MTLYLYSQTIIIHSTYNWGKKSHTFKILSLKVSKGLQIMKSSYYLWCKKIILNSRILTVNWNKLIGLIVASYLTRQHCSSTGIYFKSLLIVYGGNEIAEDVESHTPHRKHLSEPSRRQSVIG